MGRFRKSSISHSEFHNGQHRFEHWYRDNSIYFITARCRSRFNAFANENTKEIFWDRFEFYTKQYNFIPFIVSLLDNHYHLLGYLAIGENLGKMMRHIHGSIAKLVNDSLDVPLKPFWYDAGKQGYFDGCIRDELQCIRAYGYTHTQCRRHGICQDPADYPHTRVYIELDRVLKRACELKPYLEDIPYKRYDQ
jgi:REP element-mobilizing transposase RayT